MIMALRKNRKVFDVCARQAFMLALLCCSLTVTRAQSGQADNLARGVVIENVVCRADASQSYALYIPSNYRPEKKWPVLYALDPLARGNVPLGRFKEAAEKYGYIVAGSNISKNGPIKASINAFEAVWNDTHARFSIDNGRVYATGFSGGARAALFIATLCEKCITGVIACGAGFNPQLPPSKSIPFVLFATVGVDDFNYPELMELDATLEKYGIQHRVATFDGTHSWPPSELCVEALEWMEIEAIKAGRRPKDGALVRELFDKNLKRAQALEEQKKVYEAYGVYRSLAASFKGLEDTSAIEKKVSKLKDSKEIKEQIKAEKAQIEKQRLLAADLMKLARSFDDPELSATAPDDLRKHVAELRKKADVAQDSGERRVARRALLQVYAQFYEAGTIHDAANRSAATTKLEIAAEIMPQDPGIFYQLAILYAQGGEKRRAIDALKRAVENGLRNVSLIEGNKEFNGLHEETEYQKIIEGLKAKSG